MKTIFILLFTLLFLTGSSYAKVWRVNNNATGEYGENLGGNIAFPVFPELENAQNSQLVKDGDTLHLEGSNNRYDNVTLTKRLIIIGTGYLLSQNQNTSVTGLESAISYIWFNAGSSGSQIIGVHVGPNINGIRINTSNILIKRCRLDDVIILTSDITDIIIVQSFFPKSVGNETVLQANSNGFPTYIIFNNNIVERTLLLPNNPAYVIDECKNNVFAGPSGLAIRMYVGSFQNNILINQNATVILNGSSGPFSNLNISHNVSSLAASQFGTAFNNIEAIMTNVFTNLSATSDAGYQLKPNSAASNNGSDGSDRGALGGASAANRYTFSGLAPIPVIYQISTPGAAGPSGLQVTLKARAIQ